MGKFRIARDESARVAGAFLVHEQSDALVDAGEFLRVAETNSVFRIEEHAALLFRHGRLGEVTRLELDVRRYTGGDRVRVRVLDGLRRNVRRNHRRKRRRRFLVLRVQDHFAPDLLRRGPDALARRNDRRRFAGNDPLIALDRLEGKMSFQRTRSPVHCHQDGLNRRCAAAAHRREERSVLLPS